MNTIKNEHVTRDMEIDKFLAAVVKSLDIDLDEPLVEEIVDGRMVHITTEQFCNKAIETEAWHETLIDTTAFVLEKKVYENESGFVTKEMLEDAKENICYFWSGIALDAYKSGVRF